MQFGIKKLLTLSSAFLFAWLALRFLLPLISPFLFGGALALAAEPVVSFLHKHLRLPRSVSTGIGVSFTFFLLCALLLLLCAFAIRELSAVAGSLPDYTVALQSGISALHDWLLRLSRNTPQMIQPLLRDQVNDLFSSGTALLDQAVRYIAGFAGNLLSHVPNSALTAGTAVLSAFMISAKLPSLRRQLLRRISGERLRAMLAAWKRVRHVVSGWLLAQCKLMGVTFLILLGGFFILRISRPLGWAVGTALVDAFPVLGTGTVLIPWALLCLLQGDTGRAIGLAGLYAAVSLIRSGLEPRLVGRQLGMDPLLTLITLYIGFKLWGIGGMLLAPVLTVAALQVLPGQSS